MLYALSEIATIELAPDAKTESRTTSCNGEVAAEALLPGASALELGATVLGSSPQPAAATAMERIPTTGNLGAGEPEKRFGRKDIDNQIKDCSRELVLNGRPSCVQDTLRRAAESLSDTLGPVRNKSVTDDTKRPPLR